MKARVNRTDRFKNALLLLYVLLVSGFVLSNNIVVSNVTLKGRDIASGKDNEANFSMIQFDVTWDNSWSNAAPNNWDAAWVFAKFRLGTADYLSAVTAASSGSLITVTSTVGLRVGMPVFVNSGTGVFSAGTVITNINSATTFTVSAAPTTALVAGAVVRAERIWEHCWLNNIGHNRGSIGGGANVQAGLQDEGQAFHFKTNPALGVYYYRNSRGAGTFSTTGAQLRWNYGAQGIKDNDIVDVRVSAIEMVYIPTETHRIDTAQYLSSTALLIDGDGTNGSQNNTFLDGSSNNFTVTRNGNVAQGPVSPFCGTGGSAFFDGSGDYLSVPDNAAFDIGSGSFTMESWVYLTAFPVNSSGYFSSMIACQDGSSSSNRSWTFSISGTSTSYTTVNVTLFTSGSPVGSSGTFNFLLNTWYHVAAVRNGTTLRLYVNGTDVGGGTNATTASNSASSITIGAEDPTWQGSYPYWFPGYISNLRILKGTAVYTANFTPPTSPLSAISGTQLLLKFENAAIDDTRRRSNIETVGNAQISTTQSRFGGASVFFSTNTSYLSLAPSNDWAFGSGDFTVETWLYATGNQTSAGIMGNRPGGASTTAWQMLFYTTANRPEWHTGSAVILTSTSNITLNTWNHVAFCRAAGTLRVFINGVQSGAVADANNYSTLAALNINRDNNAYNSSIGTTCYFDDIRITKGVALYTATFTPPASALSISTSGFPIASENALVLGGNLASSLKYGAPNVSVANDFTSGASQNLASTFPKGFNGFYCMKYEVTQQQWMNFFNTLTSVQKANRDITSSTGKNSDAIIFRNNISWTSGDATLIGNTHIPVACNYLNWPDAAAYADWAGLRPMTELEFEKAARGIGAPLMNEPVTGSVSCTGDANLVAATGITNGGLLSEVISPATANAIFGNQTNVQGPLRSGVLATATSTRTSAGASYYGVMDLGGNLSEQVVTMGLTAGRSFNGAHGNGMLNRVGNSDVATWPGYVTTEISGANGSGKRGGSWEDVAARLLISDRFLANTAVTNRDRSTGFRGVRSNPTSVIGTIGLPAGTLTTLNCAAPANAGVLVQGALSSGISSTIAYAGGNGGAHTGQTVTSTGVTGLTATLAPGSFANGNGNLLYTITGTPSALGTASFAINIGGQTCTLIRTVELGTITFLDCASATNTGTLSNAVAANSTSSIPYLGGNGGPYAAQTINSTGVAGLTASISAGLFANGSGSITYVITGTPTSVGTANFLINIGGQTCTLSRTVNVFFLCGTSTVTFTYNAASVTYGTVVGANSKCWLDRNLGASVQATTSTDASSYGDLFQWGRGADGHQIRTPAPTTIAVLSSTDSPGNAQFITTSGAPVDWRSGQNNNLWQGVLGVNNPCPDGYRLPTDAEWDAERASWANQNATGAFNSPLRLTRSGYRENTAATLTNSGSNGNYWSSTISSTNARSLDFTSSTAALGTFSRANALAVRCIRD